MRSTRRPDNEAAASSSIPIGHDDRPKTSSWMSGCYCCCWDGVREGAEGMWELVSHKSAHFIIQVFLPFPHSIKRVGLGEVEHDEGGISQLVINPGHVAKPLLA